MEVIAACEFIKGGMGYKGELPWTLVDDMRRFKKITSYVPINSGKRNMVVMGRKTWESIGKIPLKDRLNVVVTSNPVVRHAQHQDVIFVRTLQDAINIALANATIHKLFVIGGTGLYDEALRHPLCSLVHMTFVHKSKVVADTFFPLPTLYANYCVRDSSRMMQDEYSKTWYSYLTYVKK